MKRTNAIRYTLSTAFLLLLLVASAGCTDAVTGSETFDDAPASAKMRHVHLFGQRNDAGKLVHRYEDLVTQTEFIVAVEKTVLDMSRVVGRYEEEPGVTVKRSFRKAFKGFAMHVDSAHIARLLLLLDLDDEIAWVEPDPRIQFNKPTETNLKPGNGQIVPWGIDRIDADLSSTASGDGQGAVRDVEVFILDTGVKGHDMSLVDENTPASGDGLDFTGANDARDNLGHGSHIAGIIGAHDDVDGVVGVAPGVTLHSYKVLDENGQAELSTVIEAVDHVTEQKALNPATPMVVNISFGADVGTTEYNALDLAIAESIAQGVIYVIAAGNEGIDVSTVTPAHLSEAITVGAYGQNDEFASFSNYGPMVDLLAPGVEILSNSNATGAKMPPVKMSGTSMAAPHVAGAAALYLSQNPTATQQEVQDALVQAGRAWVTNTPAGTTTLSVYTGDF